MRNPPMASSPLPLPSPALALLADRRARFVRPRLIASPGSAVSRRSSHRHSMPIGARERVRPAPSLQSASGTYCARRRDHDQPEPPTPPHVRGQPGGSRAEYHSRQASSGAIITESATTPPGANYQSGNDSRPRTPFRSQSTCAANVLACRTALPTLHPVGTKTPPRCPKVGPSGHRI